MNDDFSQPQPFNVEIGAHEAADDGPPRFILVQPQAYDPPPSTGDIQPEADLYPPVRYGVRGPRVRRIR